MQKAILRYLVVGFILISALFGGSKPLKIEKYFTRSSSSDVSICARVDEYFGSVNGDKAKPYIKVIPNQYFKVRLSYDEICIKGLKPQTDYSITIDKNIPLGSVSLDKTYIFTQKTGDYSPTFNFKDSGYILPSRGDISIPIEVMNIDKLSVSLYRINRNNLIGAINRYGLIEKVSSYTLDDIKNRDGYMLWKKMLPINQIDYQLKLIKKFTLQMKL